jgi:hypothetical protein
MAEHDKHHDTHDHHGPVPAWLLGVIGVITIFFFAYIFMYLKTPANSPHGF